jgi:hypothetical protein
MEPVTGCSSNHAQMAAPDNGKTADESSPGNPPETAAHWVLNSSSWQATKVVFVAGRIPLNWAMRKNSNRPRCTRIPTAAVNHHPPRSTTISPKMPTAEPLSTRLREDPVRYGLFAIGVVSIISRLEDQCGQAISLADSEKEQHSD